MNRAVAPWGWDSAWPAPAKLNLFLHVTGRRDDGYHLLQTVFRFVDHGDALRFAPRDDDRIERQSELTGVPADADLVVRAARLLQQATGCRQGASIVVDKRLPMGGGLGGGSSDAATVLLALNHLWRTGLSRAELQRLGLTLGADVPVFVFGDNAWAEGIGEELRPLDLPPAWYLVLEPPLQVPTAAIFGSPKLRRDTPPLPFAAWTAPVGELPGRNDLEAVASALHPLLREHLDWLSGFAQARMSGSGACVFAEFASREAAEKAWAQRPPGMRGWVAEGLAEHPLKAL
jgi:4-diphosphocytidyl-2-C-methyl-D-erythritol kinase